MLNVGDPAPEFDLLDHRGKRHDLAQYRGKRFIVYFYPKADTPGCTKQSCGFRDRIRDFDTKQVPILGVSFDTQAENKAFAEKFSLPFPLLCDVERKMGLAYRACQSSKDAYPRRITYVIGTSGQIEQAIDTKDPAGQAAELAKLL